VKPEIDLRGGTMNVQESGVGSDAAGNPAFHHGSGSAAHTASSSYVPARTAFPSSIPEGKPPPTMQRTLSFLSANEVAPWPFAMWRRSSFQPSCPIRSRNARSGGTSPTSPQAGPAARTRHPALSGPPRTPWTGPSDVPTTNVGYTVRIAAMVLQDARTSFVGRASFPADGTAMVSAPLHVLFHLATHVCRFPLS